MAQASYTIPDSNGITFLSNLNALAQAVQSTNAGPVPPSDTAPGMLWLDTGADPPVLRLRNPADDGWIKLVPDSFADLGLSGPGLVGRAAAGAGPAGEIGSAAGLTAALAAPAALATPSGAANWAPDWASFLSADWQITGNRTLGNPINVTPGTTRVVRARGDNATNRTISFGLNFRGDLNGGPVTATGQLVYTLFAVTSTLIVVSALAVEVSE